MDRSIRWGLLLLLICLVPYAPSGAQPSTVAVSGYVRDAESGESLVGVHVRVSETTLGAATDQYGRFVIVTPPGTLALSFSYIGYDTHRLSISLRSDTLLQIRLQPAVVSLDSIRVLDSQELPTATSGSVVAMTPAEIKQIPMLGGEADVIKALQLMPGVQSGREGSTGLHVRGGGPDQNLILLDGTPIYSVNHLFGFMSAFSPDVIRSVSLTKGAGSARYGGRLSSVLDIALKEGDLNKRRTHVNVGVISGLVTLEGPIKKGRVSYLVSARRTYLDALLLLFQPPGDKYGYYFMDGIGKLAYVSDKHGFYLSLYGGQDRFWFRSRSLRQGSADRYRSYLNWGNLTGSLRWQGQLTPRVLATASLARSAYALDFFENDIEDQPNQGRRYEENVFFTSGVRDWSQRNDLTWYLPGDNEVRFGSVLIAHRFTPSSRRTASSFEDVDTTRSSKTGGIERLHAWSMALYGETQLAFGPDVDMVLGIRLSRYDLGDAAYTFPEPRFLTRYRLTDRTTVEAAVTYASQSVHLLSRSSIGVPLDLWLPATRRVRPEEAWQFTLGGTRVMTQSVQISADVYYKSMKHLITPITGSNLVGVDASNWEDRVEIGDGEAYGMEWLLRKREGRLRGWIAYTLARSTSRFANIDGGRRFPNRYDRTHDVAVTGTYCLSEIWCVSSTWVFATGNAVWLPAQRLPGVEDFAGHVSDPDYSPVPDAYDYGPRNNKREPNYHRLDISFQHTKPIGRGMRTWTIGVYNAYARRNPFFITASPRPDGTIAYKQFSPFILIPGISYDYSF